jgi:hypothetical protein
MGIAAQQTYGYAVAVDGSGNSYLAGATGGNLCGETLTGNQGGFIIKHDPSGSRLWTRLLADLGSETVFQAIAVDASGNCYIAGTTNGDLKAVHTGIKDVIVAKYDPSGTRVWIEQMGVSGAETLGCSIAVAGDYVYVAGNTTGALDGQTYSGGQCIFIQKYSTGGVKQWTRLLGAACVAAGIGVDPSGNSYVTGTTWASPFDSQTWSGVTGLYVTKYSTSGDRQWTRVLGAVGVSVSGYGMAVDAAGNSYAIGTTGGSLDAEHPLTGYSDAIVVKRNQLGVLQWIRMLGVTNAATNG